MEKDFDKENGCFVAGVRKVYTLIELKKKKIFVWRERERERERVKRLKRRKKMIHFLLLQNRQGQTRLSRWYIPVQAEEKGKVESEVHRMITSRPTKFSNFINVRILY